MSLPKFVIGVSATLAVCGVALATVAYGHRARTGDTVELQRAKAKQAGQEIQRRIAAAVATDAPRIKSQAELETYLGSMEKRARQHGMVSALEVEPARRIIETWRTALGPNETRRILDDFTRRMATLSAELTPSVASPPMPPAASSLAKQETETK